MHYEPPTRLWCRSGGDLNPAAPVRRLAPLIVITFLASAASAVAKELPVEVCGADRCLPVSDRGTAGFLHSTGAPTGAPEPAPFFVVRFRSASGSRPPVAWSYLYVPSAGAMRGDDFGSGSVRWMRAKFLAPVIAKLTQDIEPYPASPTWTPNAAARDDGSPLLWLALGAPAAMLAMLRIIQNLRSIVRARAHSY